MHGGGLKRRELARRTTARLMLCCLPHRFLDDICIVPSLLVWRETARGVQAAAVGRAEEKLPLCATRIEILCL